MLRVIEYFAKSLKVTDQSFEIKPLSMALYKSLFVFIVTTVEKNYGERTPY